MKITVASDEWTDVRLISQALQEQGYEVDVKIVNGSFAHNVKGDIVFNASHSFPGKHGDAFVPSALEGIGVPYTGPDALTAALCQDHVSMRGFLRQNGIRTPRYAFLRTIDDVGTLKDQKFSFPIVYRSNNSKRGEGIAYYPGMEEFQDDLVEYNENMFWPSVVDEYVAGIELPVFCYGLGRDFISLKPVQIEYNGEIYDEDAREAPTFKEPKLLETEKASIRNFAFKAHHLLGIEGWSRVDMILGTDHIPIVLEIDPNPEFDPRALATLEANNLTPSDIINYMVNISIDRIKDEQKDTQYELFMM